MIRLGLTGFPLNHSLSPQIQAAALHACGLAGSYSLFPIPAGDQRGLHQLLESLRRGELAGLNVTLPHKENVIPFLDELSLVAKSVGAVNTISIKAGRLAGDNTDVPGFLMDLGLHMAGRKAGGMERKTALVLGAGGAARAVVYALTSDGWTVTVAARRLEQARRLAAGFPECGIKAAGLHLTGVEISEVDLIVNATPAGMAPGVEQSPWPEGRPFPARAMVYDLVYNPRLPRLVREARAAGLQATAGLGMLIGQAALAFEIWTGQNPPREAMFEAAAGSLPEDFLQNHTREVPC